MVQNDGIMKRFDLRMILAHSLVFCVNPSLISFPDRYHRVHDDDCTVTENGDM